jgi:hypothetical protein
MTVTISKPAINIREKLTEASAVVAHEQRQVWFVGDGTETDFALPRGFEPLHVFDGGALQKEGSGDDYQVVYDGFIYTVSFNTAPANLNNIGIIGVRT